MGKLAARDRGRGAARRRNRRGVAAHPRGVLHHDHARIRANDLLPRRGRQSLRRRRGPQPGPAVAGRVRARPQRRPDVLLPRARRPCGDAVRPAPIDRRPLRPRDRGDSRERDANGSNRLSDLQVPARLLRHRRQPGRARGRPARQPEQLRQPESPPLDAIGHADGHGHPRRRRPPLRRTARRSGAAAARRGALHLHRLLAASGRRRDARDRAVRAARARRPRPPAVSRRPQRRGLRRHSRSRD